MEKERDDLVQDTREKLERAEQSDPAARAEALEEMHRSLETELEKPESGEPST